MNVISTMDLQDLFNMALEQTIDNMGQNNREKIVTLMGEICYNKIPYMYAQPSYVRDIADLIFTDGPNRDFIFTLTFNFFVRAPMAADEFHVSIARDLANSVSMRMVESKDTIMPDEVNDRLDKTDDIIKLLMREKWLCVVLMISIFCRREYFEPANVKS